MAFPMPYAVAAPNPILLAVLLPGPNTAPPTALKAEGIIVDLHVVRVAPRLGIATGTDPKKIEKQMMDVLDPKTWGEVGMAISLTRVGYRNAGITFEANSSR